MEKPIGNYVVTFSTFVLQPVRFGNRILTYVIERDREVDVPKKPIHIMKSSAAFYGSSFQVLTKTSKLVLGNVHKTPILLAHAYDTPCIFIPTLSPSSEQNVWINCLAIDFIEPDPLGCIVHLENGRELKLAVSANTMWRQYCFARFLEKDFFKKQHLLNKSAYLFKPE
ncbi:competence protein ComK [Sporosarcina luteola]|nr:competence protein ComK [Sporosarcina luteola]